MIIHHYYIYENVIVLAHLSVFEFASIDSIDSPLHTDEVHRSANFFFFFYMCE